jgi:hypothetical protein
MRRVIFLFCAMLVVTLVAGCGGITISMGGESGAKEDEYPLQAVIDSPVDGIISAMGPVEIVYHATAEEGVAAVELSVDGQVLSNVTSPDSKQQLTTLTYTWQPSVGGAHVIRVRAQSSTGEWSDYGMTTVTIEGQAATAEPTATTEPTVTATPEGVKILEVTRTNSKFYFGNNTCGPVKNTFNVKISQPENTKQVLIFYRLWDKEGGGESKWDGGHAMKPLGDGNYSFTFTETIIANPFGFEFTVFHYQVAVIGKQNERLDWLDFPSDVVYEICP